MIRWAYLVPRLILIGLLLGVLGLAVDPLVRCVAISAGEAVTDVKVEIDEVETSLLHGRVCFAGVQVADPRDPMKNLFQADEIALAVEPGAVAQRKLVIGEARASGLRFGTPRAESGKLDRAPFLLWHLPGEQLIDPVERAATDVVDRWFVQLTALAGQELAKQVEQLESVRLARELMERWPAEYTRLEGRVEELKGRVARLRDTLDHPPADPAQGFESCRRAMSDLEGIRGEMSQLSAELERLKQQAQRDRDAIPTARDRDIERLRQMFHVDSLSGEGLSDYLLGPELGPQVATLARWVACARQYIPQQVQDAVPQRDRGVNIAFPRTHVYPDFLIRSLAVDGQAELGGERFAFAGLLTGVTSQPELYGQPVVARLQVTGKATVRVEAVVDRTGTTPRERILIDCPALPQPQLALGKPEQLAVTVAPGNTHVWVLLDLAGDDLSGQIQVRQEPIRIVPVVGAKGVAQVLTADLQQAARRIRSLNVALDLAGTLRKPTWKMRCDLGPQLVAAIDDLLRHEFDTRREQAVNCVKERVQGELANFERLLSARQETALGKLRQGQTEIEQFAQAAAQRVPGLANLPNLPGVPPAGQMLGKDLPAGLPGLPNGPPGNVPAALSPLRF